MRRALFLFAIVILAVAPVCAHAKSTHVKTFVPAIQPIVATYDVYVGGIHLLTADILFEEGTRNYHALVKGQTYGLWYKVFPWNTELDATGAIKKDRLVPAEFVTHDIWGKKAKSVKLEFVKGDVKAEYTPPEDFKAPLTQAQKEGALDPVTALLQMLTHVAVEKNCDVTVPVFDGKRRFDITGKDNGAEYIDDGDYSSFKGEARLCDARFKAIAGEWSEKIKERFWKSSADGDDRDPFHIWLASPAPGMPEMAVRIETESAWGNIIMHLTKWRPAGAEDGIKIQTVTARPVKKATPVGSIDLKKTHSAPQVSEAVEH